MTKEVKKPLTIKMKLRIAFRAIVRTLMSDPQYQTTAFGLTLVLVPILPGILAAWFASEAPDLRLIAGVLGYGFGMLVLAIMLIATTIFYTYCLPVLKEVKKRYKEGVEAE